MAPCDLSIPTAFIGGDPICDSLVSRQGDDFRQYTISLASELESAPQMMTVEANLGSALDMDDAQCDNVPPKDGGTIIGTDGPDVLCGGPGDDTIIAKGGDDIVYGKGGDDDISTGKGDDVAFGGKGDDVTNGGTGTDTVDEGPGDGLELTDHGLR